MSDVKKSIGELEIRLNYAKSIGSGGVIISDRCAETVLGYIRAREEEIAELTEKLASAPKKLIITKLPKKGENNV